MSELLAPAGNMESLIAAISNGADAIYLGMNKFGARAYANNFDYEQIVEAINYAHLRNVKIYVTMNTIVYDNELNDAYEQINKLYELGVDGLIIQDLAIFNYVTENYPKLEAHCSTQMGIDDLEGALFFKNLGAKRVVLAREVPIEKIKDIRKKLNLPIEIFVHGALCVSYSGNCLMSGLIGYRSGNRGRCVGSCRKKYQLINKTTNEIISDSYLLSMKDLNTIEYIDELKFADSLKIEGRMKEPTYVANIVNLYRNALDGKKININDLNKTFNRTYTKGYIFHEDKKDISNISKPNNFGFKIGIVKKIIKNNYLIELQSELNQGDIIRIDHNNNNDINLSVVKLYDKSDNLISTANKECIIKIKEKLSIGDIVYKTKDIKYTNNLMKSYPKEYKRFPLNLDVYGNENEPLSITAYYDDISYYIQSKEILSKALNKPTDYNKFFDQFNRLNDTVYYLNNVNYFVNNCYIPAKLINELRRNIIDNINNLRLEKRLPIKLKKQIYEPIFFEETKPKLSVYCNTLEQYNIAKELNIDIIYYKDNIIRRNENKYIDKKGPLLIGGYGGLYKYIKTNEIYTDFSFNVVNYKTVYLLHKYGVKQICLSYEINQEQIKNLINNYNTNVGGYPNLELIIYGRADMMFTTYCPLKVLNQCGKCKNNEYVLKEEYGEFPIISHDDCTTTILNGKILNLIDDFLSIEHINTYRIQLTKETKEESKQIIEMFREKINTNHQKKLFNKEINTRGHFNKEIL